MKIQKIIILLVGFTAQLASANDLRIPCVLSGAQHGSKPIEIVCKDMFCADDFNVDYDGRTFHVVPVGGIGRMLALQILSSSGKPLATGAVSTLGGTSANGFENIARAHIDVSVASEDSPLYELSCRL